MYVWHSELKHVIGGKERWDMMAPSNLTCRTKFQLPEKISSWIFSSFITVKQSPASTKKTKMHRELDYVIGNHCFSLSLLYFASSRRSIADVPSSPCNFFYSVAAYTPPIINSHHDFWSPGVFTEIYWISFCTKIYRFPMPPKYMIKQKKIGTNKKMKWLVYALNWPVIWPYLYTVSTNTGL